MPEFGMDLNKLYQAGNSWRSASDLLGQGSIAADALEHDHTTVTWGLFQEVWDAHVSAARYMRERMAEGRLETESLGETLNHVANVHHQQDQDYAEVIVRLEEY